MSKAHCRKVNQWLQEDFISLDKADEIDLNSVINNVRKRLKKWSKNQTAHIIPSEKILKFPRLLDIRWPLEPSWNNEKLGFTHPLVPKNIIRNEDVEKIKNTILNKQISSFVVFGPKLSGKTTVTQSHFFACFSTAVVLINSP